MSCSLGGVNHTHGLANLAKRLVRDLVRPAVAVGQDVGGHHTLTPIVLLFPRSYELCSPVC